MKSPVIAQLDQFGPGGTQRLDPQQAQAYTRELANGHYENFSVVSRLLPQRLHQDFANVYSFCRWADDLGDEVESTEQAEALLAWWKQQLHRCYAGEAEHPVYVALRTTIDTHDLPMNLFEDLIDAFEQDQRVRRYDDWTGVLDYCRRSANPVGRLVLNMSDCADPDRCEQSDATCTALQLINFWQDVRRDILERDRIYIPRDALAAHDLRFEMLIDHAHGKQAMTGEQRIRYRAMMAELMQRTQHLFDRGKTLWPSLPREMQLPIRLFTLGGEAVMRRVHAMQGDTLDRRPALNKRDKIMLMMRGWVGWRIERLRGKTPAQPISGGVSS